MAAFVGISGDFNPLYTDAEHARGGHFGEPIVPGALVAAVTTGLGAIDVPVPATVGLVGMTWRFLRPVRPGDTISSLWRLNRKRPVENPKWGLAEWQVEVENQRGEVVAVADVTRLVSRREQPAEAVRSGKSSRRRRRRGIPEIAAGADLPPKPTPGPIREPLVRPAAEAPWRVPQQPQQPAPPQQPEPASAPEPQVAEGTSRRRRRGSDRARPEPAAPQPEPQVAEVPAVAQLVVVEPQAPPAEPAPAVPESQPAAVEAAPQPSSRRRRRRSAAPPEPLEPAPVPAVEPGAWVPPGAPEPVPEPASEPAPPPASRPRRRRASAAPRPAAEEQPAAEPNAEPRPPRRRRRPRAAEPAATDERPPDQRPPAEPAVASPVEPPPPPIVEPQPIPSPFRPPTEAPTASDGSGGALAGVLRRLRGN